MMSLYAQNTYLFTPSWSATLDTTWYPPYASCTATKAHTCTDVTSAWIATSLPLDDFDFGVGILDRPNAHTFTRPSTRAPSLWSTRVSGS